MFSVCILIVDLTLIPYVFAWDVPMNQGFLSWFVWFTVIFWTADIGLNFVTGFVSEGEKIMKFSAIAQNYIKGWLILDLVIVSCDWASVLLGQIVALDSDEGGTTIWRNLSVLRIAKMRPSHSGGGTSEDVAAIEDCGGLG